MEASDSRAGGDKKLLAFDGDGLIKNAHDFVCGFSDVFNIEEGIC